MYFLITRPLIDAQNLVENLPVCFMPICEPMLRVIFPDIKAEINEVNESENQAIIFTSSNAVRAVKDFGRLYNLKAFTVGEKTAKLVESAGFKEVVCIGANVAEAISYFDQEKEKLPRSLIYLRGNRIKKDLKSVLSVLGYNIEQIIVYKTEQVDSFSSKVRALFEQDQLKAASFYSQATAINYIRLATEFNLKENHRQIEAFALSEQIAEILEQIKWRRVNIAKRPTEKEMMELIFSRYEKK